MLPISIGVQHATVNAAVCSEAVSSNCPDLYRLYPYLFRQYTVSIGASEMPGFVISALVPNTLDDNGCLQAEMQNTSILTIRKVTPKSQKSVFISTKCFGCENNNSFFNGCIPFGYFPNQPRVPTPDEYIHIVQAKTQSFGTGKYFPIWSQLVPSPVDFFVSINTIREW